MLSPSQKSVIDATPGVPDGSLRRRPEPQGDTNGHETKIQDSNLSSARPQPRALLSFIDLPSWYQDNTFILANYRPVNNSGLQCFESWFYLHNETANIYTHLFAVIIFVIGQSMMQHYLASLYPEIEVGDRLAMAVQGATAVICFVSSVTYHSLMCHSEPIFRFSLKCDYIGIITLIIGNFLSGLHLSFHCQPALAKTYSVMILTLGSTTAFVVISPTFQGPRWFKLRLWAFMATGLTGFLPILHGLWIFGPELLMRLGVHWYVYEALILIAGAYIFANRIPECWAPGLFDIWGHSHSLWHVLVVLGMLAHVVALMKALDFKYTGQICSELLIS